MVSKSILQFRENHLMPTCLSLIPTLFIPLVPTINTGGQYKYTLIALPALLV